MTSVGDLVRGRTVRGAIWIAIALSLLLTSVGCCSTSQQRVTAPLPANRVTRPTVSEVSQWVEGEDWPSAIRALLRAHNYIDSLERDGLWDR